MAANTNISTVTPSWNIARPANMTEPANMVPKLSDLLTMLSGKTYGAKMFLDGS